jgi:hypothetical protein
VWLARLRPSTTAGRPGERVEPDGVGRFPHLAGDRHDVEPSSGHYPRGVRQFAFPGCSPFVARTDDGRVSVGVDGADDDSRGTVITGRLPRPLA